MVSSLAGRSNGGSDLQSHPSTPDHKRYQGRMMNLMFDPRVVRGPTYPYNPRAKPELNNLHDPAGARRAQKNKPKTTRSPFAATPEPLNNRKHFNAQTDGYLEEFVERLSEYDMDTQTDPFLDRPPTPLFIPQKSGPDVGTQIEEGDLFNFDEEVEPIVEVLVGRTLEQSLMEVMEEKQIANLHAYQEHFEQMRAAELVATQRMEAAERRIIEEKKKHVQQEKKRLEEEEKAKEKAELHAYVKDYLKDMHDSIFRTLQKLNYFYDPVEREVEEKYLPFLMEKITQEMKTSNLARSTFKKLVETNVSSFDDQIQSRVAKVVTSMVTRVDQKHKKLSSNVGGLMEELIKGCQEY